LIFREITPASASQRNFRAQAVLVSSGETYLRRNVSKFLNIAYFCELGLCSNGWNFFHRFCETEYPNSARSLPMARDHHGRGGNWE
jgi:hypothetical protein